MFDCICVIGNGMLAKCCCKILAEKHDNVIFFDANSSSSWYLKKQFESIQNVIYQWYDKSEIFEKILQLSGKILIISAVNPYIIPKSIVDNDRIEAINLHHSLLPLHPGRNAEAWTIYEEDNYGGITWHNVTSTVDGGDIISSGVIELNDKMTSWKLLKIQNDLAISEFSKFVDKLLEGNLQCRKQDNNEECKMHYSYEKPNGGIFDMQWPAKKMSAFLRAMDYGPAKVLGNPQIQIENKIFEIIKYTINDIQSEKEEIVNMKNRVQIKKDNLEINLYIQD